MNPKRFKKAILSLPINAKVLDAGCGSGNNSRYILKIRSDLDICCIDLNSQYKNNVNSFAKFNTGSIENMKNIYKDNFFDCIICFHVLEHLQSPYKAASEFKRVLKPRGFLIAESPHWISLIMPIGFNFYDDPTHIRPFTKTAFRKYLFRDFRIRYLKFETPVFYYLSNLYNIKKLSFYYIFRKILHLLGLYKTAVFMIAQKI